MAVLFVDSGDGLYTRLFSFCIGLHIISSLRNDNSGVFVGVCACVTRDREYIVSQKVVLLLLLLFIGE